MRLSLRRALRLVFGFCLLLMFFGGFLSPVKAAEPSDPNSLAWAWALNCPCANGCECTPADNCGCLSPISAPAQTVVGYQDVQVCENGKCKIVRVAVYGTPAPAQKSELATAWPSFPTNHGPQGVTYYAPATAGGCSTCSPSTTVQGSYSAPSGYNAAPGGYQLFHPLQNLRTFNQNRPKLFGGGGFFRGGCGSCGN